MSVLSENVIPGKQGRVFGTNVKRNSDLERIRETLLELDGIDEVKLNFDSFPKEFIVFTHKLVRIEDVEEVVISTGFHAIPKENLDI